AHHRSHRAERGGHPAAAQPAAHRGPDRPGGRVHRRAVPRPARRADLAPAELGRHARAAARRRRGGHAHAQTRRLGHRRPHPARADHPRQQRPRLPGRSMNSVREAGAALEWTGRQQQLRVEPWGPGAIRVRAAIGPVHDGLPGALDRPPDGHEARVKVENGSARLTNGAITAELSTGPSDHGQAMVRFTRTDTGAELLAEEPIHFWWPGPRLFAATGNGYYRLEQRFRAYPGERLFGLGQHGHGLLDQKGAVLDLAQRNGEVSIPFLLSSRGYGLLWNNPAIGRVELAANGTRWVADSARQIDYWVTAGSPAEILHGYADATGHAPVLPEWAAGFWQSKLRYRTQDELVAVAREYKARGLPLAVITADYFHWTHLGDWKFDPAEWPDPAALTAELGRLG